MKSSDNKLVVMTVTNVTVSDPFVSGFGGVKTLNFKSSGAVKSYKVESRAVEKIKSFSALDMLQPMTYFAERLPVYGCSLEQEWDEWNNEFISIISKIQDQLREELASFECIQNIASRIPNHYSLKSRLEHIRGEVDVDEEGEATANVKSFLCMLRFVPILQEKQRNIGFYVNESKRFGITLGEGVGFKSLDLLFKEDGEVYFSYMERGDGISRVSGSSYLTEYLVNSKKVRKIFNLFDY